MPNKLFTPDIENKTLTEKATMEKPVAQEADYYVNRIREFDAICKEFDIYNDHIDSLQKYTASWLNESHRDRTLELGKDFELHECENCDGVGWHEGGKNLKTHCVCCNGTGVIAIPIENKEGEETKERVIKYSSPYPDAVKYTCDKNFLVRLKAMIDRNGAALGIRRDDKFKALIESMNDAEDYLFSSVSTTTPADTGRKDDAGEGRCVIEAKIEELEYQIEECKSVMDEGETGDEQRFSLNDFIYDFEDRINKLRQSLQSSKPQSATLVSDGWVDVKDRLPECNEKFGESDYVLAIDEYGAQVVVWFTNKSNDWKVAHSRASSLPIIITHWQPLPSPPQTQQP